MRVVRLVAPLPAILISAVFLAQSANTPRNAVTSFFNLLKSEQYEALYLHLPSKMQQRFSRDRFTLSMKRIGDYIRLERMDIGRVQQRGNYAVVDTTLYGQLKRPMNLQGQTISAGRVSVQQLLIKEGTEWKVITADERVRTVFLEQNPDFSREFDMKPPRLEFKQNDKWRVLGGQ
jgi:hypothetical protein